MDRFWYQQKDRETADPTGEREQKQGTEGALRCIS